MSGHTSPIQSGHSSLIQFFTIHLNLDYPITEITIQLNKIPCFGKFLLNCLLVRTYFKYYICCIAMHFYYSIIANTCRESSGKAIKVELPANQWQALLCSLLHYADMTVFKPYNLQQVVVRDNNVIHTCGTFCVFYLRI